MDTDKYHKQMDFTWHSGQFPKQVIPDWAQDSQHAPAQQGSITAADMSSLQMTHTRSGGTGPVSALQLADIISLKTRVVTSERQ